MSQTLKKLWAFFTPRIRWKLAYVAALAFVGGIVEMAGIGLFLPFLQLVLSPERLHTLVARAELSGLLDGIPDSRLILLLSGSMFVFYLFKNLYLYVVNAYSLALTYHAEEETKVALLRAYLTMPYVNRLGHNTALFLRTITHSTHIVFKGVLNAAMILAQELILALSAIGILLYVEPLGGLMATAMIAVLLGLLYFPVRRRMSQGGSEAQATHARIFQWLNQSFGAPKETILMKREDYFLSHFGREAHHLADIIIRLHRLMTLPRHVVEITVIGAMLGYLSGVILSHPQGITDILPVMGVFAAASLRLMPSANRIIQQVNHIRQGGPAVNIVHADLFNAETAAPLQASQGQPAVFNHTLSVKNVSFTYPDAKRAAVEDVSISIGNGDVVALMGASGSGKTTLADLILGLFDPAEGQILADGLNIHANLDSWQKQIGYVPQQTYLLDDTVRRNVAFGLHDGQIDESRLNEAILQAQLTQVVDGLPNGLDTMLGEHGARLSGGQRQRIGIARALYHQPSLLVFDEATSALDGETERDIVDAIEGLRGSKTMIIIAHRLSTVSRCDRLFFLDNGRLSDQGRFEELVERSEGFRRMTQASSETPGLAKEMA